jgi:hypothetical protein
VRCWRTPGAPEIVNGPRRGFWRSRARRTSRRVLRE